MDSNANQFKFLLVFVFAIAGIPMFNLMTLISQQLLGIDFLSFIAVDVKYKIFITVSCFLGIISYLGTIFGVQYVLRYGRIKCVHLDLITILRSQEEAPFSWRMGRLIELLLLANASFCCSTNLLLAIVFLSAMNASWAAITLGCFHAIYATVALPLVFYLFFGFIAEPIPEGCDYWFRENRDRFMKCDSRHCLVCRNANEPSSTPPVLSISLQIDEREHNDQLPPLEASRAVPSAPPTPAAAAVTEEGEEPEVCSICFQDSANRSIDPCGHRLCALCSSRVNSCPFCRAQIVSVQRLIAVVGGN
uniref:RING-type domain-containing protein n=1 Tax=Plectus sambesii TaxID=2011161 RepID=A0A914WLD0_9BILA